jgi:hypothetical protein
MSMHPGASPIKKPDAPQRSRRLQYRGGADVTGLCKGKKKPRQAVRHNSCDASIAVPSSSLYSGMSLKRNDEFSEQPEGPTGMTRPRSEAARVEASQCSKLNLIAFRLQQHDNVRILKANRKPICCDKAVQNDLELWGVHADTE